MYRNDIDVVMLDVCMPVIDGPETLAALHELNPHVSCCFMSADTGRYTEAGLRDLGAAFLRKPFRLTEFGRLLWELASSLNGAAALQDEAGATTANSGPSEKPHCY